LGSGVLDRDSAKMILNIMGIVRIIREILNFIFFLLQAFEIF
jgi:hypothetical protein